MRRDLVVGEHGVVDVFDAHGVVSGRGTSARVAVVDDHRVIAESLLAALTADPRLDAVGFSSSIAGARRLVAAERPHVVVMDYRLADGTGADATRELRREDPELVVLMLTAYDALDVLDDAISAGCAGFLPKSASLDEVVAAVHTVAEGGTVFDPGMIARLARGKHDGPGHDLTHREREVLRFLVRGKGTRELSDELFVSIHTVRNHIRNITAKLGVQSKLEAVVIALREGIVDG